MYHFTSDVDWKRFFRFDKRWIENMNWARLSPAAKAVFPVIARYCNERGESFPGETIIAALSGLAARSARKGIHDLEGFPGFSWEYYLTKRGRQGKRFQLTFPPKGEPGRTFFFRTVIIDAGTWRKRNDGHVSGLIPAAQALYPVLRHFARYDDGEDERTYDDTDEFAEKYASRHWEICSADIGPLAKYAGISRNTVKDAIQSLQDNFLLEAYKNDDGHKGWKVFICPPKRWRPGFMNQKLKSEAGA